MQEGCRGGRKIAPSWRVVVRKEDSVQNMRNDCAGAVGIEYGTVDEKAGDRASDPYSKIPTPKRKELFENGGGGQTSA